MGNLLNIAQKRRSIILQSTMHLSYNSTTSLNLLIETVSGDDWKIDWGDGVWERYTSSNSTYRTKTFGTATAGVARVRSATGRGLSDPHRVQSTDGTWSFDATALSGLTSLDYLRLTGSGLTGDMSGVSGLTSLTTLILQGSFTLTYTTFTANLSNLNLRLQTGELSNPVDIDQMFIDLDAVATTKSGTFDVRSSGAATPTAASSAARASLVSKGRTILTN